MALSWAGLAACGGGGGGTNYEAVAVLSTEVGVGRLNETVLITLHGRNLDQLVLADLDPATTAPGCFNLRKSATAPTISTDTTAYFTCVPVQLAGVHFRPRRKSDGVLLADVPITVVVPAVTGTQVSTPIFIGQPLLITLQGTELQQRLSVTATGCGAVRKSTVEPHVSTETTAYYRCVPTTAGDVQVVAKRAFDNVDLVTVPFTVPAEVPPSEVTLTVSNGAGVSGDIVITLEPAKAPITVGNFLEYVADGYYKDMVFHRLVPDFIIQGGGYAKTLDPTATTLPTLKDSYGGITLEDDAGLLNLKNTIAMARTSTPDSANSQFFFNLKDNANLDRVGSSQRGYAVFGTITAGTDVLTAMTTAPCSAWAAFLAGDDPNACVPSPNIVITNAVRTR